MIKQNKIAAALSLALFAISAHAADATPAHFMVGAGVAAIPEYSGADKLRALPVLQLDYQNSDGFFVSTARGIGYGSKIDAFSLSAAIGYDAGRGDKNEHFYSGSDALKGMGKIDGAALANLGVVYDAGAFSLNAQASLALSNRERGNSYQFGAAMPLLTAESDQVMLGAHAKYSDNKNMQTFHGVTAAQSLRSGYKVYSAKKGLESVGLDVNWNHVIDKRWSVATVVGLTRLSGDAASSPLTKRKTSPLLASVVNYAF